jgi:peptide deformylase
MALLKIKVYPDPILKLKAQPLSEFGPKEQKLFDDMIETMYVEDGVGLAAPQIGVSKRILIASPTMKHGEEYVIVNPEIYESSGRQTGPEGCLSFPGISGEVERAKKIRVRFLDRYGKPRDLEAKDFFARIIQHEMDHLDGILLIDRVGFGARQELLAHYKAV